jgi:hypothetical protein
MPFVPAFLKALAAVDDAALLEAWLQARALFDDPRLAPAAARLRGAADPGIPYRATDEVRAVVAPFVDELPVLLLVITSLALTLDGEIPAGPLPAGDLPPPGPLPPTDVAEERGEHPLFHDVCRVYGTTYVPSMYRALAARGVLVEPWTAIGPYLDGAAGRARIERVAAAARAEAAALPEAAVLRSEAARPVLDQFRRALPRNLVFAVAASARP